MNNPFDDLFSLSDAARMWGKEESTLRRVFHGPRFHYGLDVKKFGKQWVVRGDAMRRVYGEPIEKDL